MTDPSHVNKINKNWGVIIAIVFIASTLRAPLTSVGPVVDEIKHVMEINNSVAVYLQRYHLLFLLLYHRLSLK